MSRRSRPTLTLSKAAKAAARRQRILAALTAAGVHIDTLPSGATRLRWGGEDITMLDVAELQDREVEAAVTWGHRSRVAQAA